MAGPPLPCLALGHQPRLCTGPPPEDLCALLLAAAPPRPRPFHLPGPPGHLGSACCLLGHKAQPPGQRSPPRGEGRGAGPGWQDVLQGLCLRPGL
ncbi:unnamed protein product [Rangifer tarandus platyrhynchus]|uniref:Uncharacterized protein n=1 Tax=Rangifer tarandus platyrhynchus TaxID=3082113 RepID=A0AC59YFA1_RANTA